MSAATEVDDRRQLRRLAWWLDSSIPVPGTQWRIGLDPLIGLVPGLGDFVGLGVSAYIVAHGVRRGAPPAVLARMAANVALESLLGMVPLVGDVFDAVWKANQRNVRLLDEFLERPARTRRTSTLLVALAVTGVLVLFATGAVVMLAVLRWAFTSLF